MKVSLRFLYSEYSFRKQLQLFTLVYNYYTTLLKVDYVCGMKANEFRIGNLLQTSSEEPEIFVIDEIDSVEETVCGSGLMDVKLSDLLRIPLTEEWLVRFGFEGKAFFGLTAMCITFEGADLFIEFTGEEETPCVAWYCLEDDSPKPLAYPMFAHSLQNLVFALSGNELTLKD